MGTTVISARLVEFYERSRELARSDAIEAATIPVEKFPGELIFADGDDKVGPSSQAALNIAVRRAGHPIVLPGETRPT